MSGQGVVKFRRKPDPAEKADQVAAKWEPGGDLAALLWVARRADLDAELAEVAFPSGMVLVVRYTDYPDDGPRQIRFIEVQPGHWLAWSQDSDFLYDTTDHGWEQFYDRIEGGS